MAALVAALAGSAGEGAYGPKDKKRWGEIMDYARQGNMLAFEYNFRVMGLAQLIDRACEPGGIEWTAEPLVCSPDDRELLNRLTSIRDDFEHPKPSIHCFDFHFVTGTFTPACRLIIDALTAVEHHFDESRLERLKDVVQQITDRAASLISRG